MNSNKTCLIIVNFTQNYQFPGCPSLLQTVLETKLLGFWFTHDIKVHCHINHILKISYKRIWAIRKLKKAGISDTDILYFYFMKIRSVLETNCVVYHSMLTLENIERIQKKVIKIILEHRYSDYHQGCLLLGISTLPQRRVKLCLNFVLKCLTNAKFKNLFKLNTNTNIRNPDKYDIPLARTTRYFNSPLLFITRLLNSHFKNIHNT